MHDGVAKKDGLPGRTASVIDMKIRPVFAFARRLPPSVIILTLLMILGAYLRLKAITFQSLWLDELHTMIEANPANKIGDVLAYLTKNDQHPPLYFLLVHFWFQFVGYNDFTARLLSAIAGVLGIPVMYLLGKELYSRNVGYVCAVFTTFNYFDILYSQEARGYVFAFAFSCLSFLCLIRALRNPTLKSAVWYALSTSLLLYTHYFGLIIVASQIVIVLMFLMSGAPLKRFLFCFAISYGLLLILYAPWISKMFSTANQITNFWIKKPTVDFFVSYFQAYFGNDIMTIYIMAFLLILFLAGTLLMQSDSGSIPNPFHNRYLFSFIVLMTWILVSYLVPFEKSVISVPMLHPRYTIVILPAIFLAAGIGLDLIFSSLIKIYLTVLIALLSVMYLFTYSEYYEKPRKAQWRQMQSFIVSQNRENFPIISDRAWHLGYYFSLFKASPHFITESSINAVNSVWIVTVFHGNPVSPETKQILNRDFRITRSFYGLDCAAELFIRENMTLKLTGGIRRKNGFFVLYDNGTIRADPVELSPGRYNIVISGYGTKLQNVYPEILLSLNGKIHDRFYLSELKEYVFPFQWSEKSQITLALQFVNDAMNSVEDRNVFINYVGIKAIKPRQKKK